MTDVNRLQGAKLYTFTPASAYGANVNILPSIREAIKTAFPNMDWENREADIVGISIKSSLGFTVKLNYGTSIVAQNDGTSYITAYAGCIDHVVFAASTTASAVTVYWNQHDKTHKLVQLNIPTGVTATLTDDFGYKVYPDADGKFELSKGYYLATSGSETIQFLYDFSDTTAYLDFETE